ncbi:interleukin 17-like protein isoform X2 [Mizuhopecten yessoensis]|uniref:interleukin 17-like protein isoform X2 n=1 Tax=Mizuhopecten yessoensis TaxID=6573 RepID=UPI000B45F599|nr:interleukin 17-like protein isoform X2 [Mizuhopecten yessoensis]
MNSLLRIITMLAVIEMVVSACVHTTSTCGTPARVNLAIQLRSARNSISPESLLLTARESDRQSSNVTTTILEGETNVCPENLNELDNTMHTPTRHRSTCPYYMVSEHNPNRFPATLTSVRCRCQQCLEAGGRSLENVCEPVYVTEVVLMQGECDNDVFQYNPTEIQIQVACTCARRREEESSSDNEGPIPI